MKKRGKRRIVIFIIIILILAVLAVFLINYFNLTGKTTGSTGTAVIQGTIYNHETNLPVNYIWLILLKEGRLVEQKYNNVDGSYKFKNLEPGSYRLIYNSYRTNEYTENKVIIDVNGQQTVTKNIYLIKREANNQFLSRRSYPTGILSYLKESSGWLDLENGDYRIKPISGNKFFVFYGVYTKNLSLLSTDDNSYSTWKNGEDSNYEGYKVQDGDILSFLEYVINIPGCGMEIDFTDGTHLRWTHKDQNNYYAQRTNPNAHGKWYQRRVDISDMKGKTVKAISFVQEADRSEGDFFECYFDDVKIESIGLNRPPRIETRGDKIFIDFKEFNPFGVYYSPLYSTIGTSWVQNMDERIKQIIQKDFKIIKDLGYNHVVIFLVGQPIDLSSYCENLNYVFDQAYENNLMLSLRMPYTNAWSPEDPSSYMVFNKEKLQELITTCEIDKSRSVIGYITDSAPSFEIFERTTREVYPLEQRARMRKEVVDAWKDWVLDRYKTFENFEGITGHNIIDAPTDDELCAEGSSIFIANYRTFLNYFQGKKYYEVVKAIREVDSSKLILSETEPAGASIINFCPFVSYNFRYLQKDLNAISIDYYVVTGAALKSQDRIVTINYEKIKEGYFLNEYYKVGKPVMIGEFGYETFCFHRGRSMDIEECGETPEQLQNQVNIYKKVFEMAENSGFVGMNGWWLIGKRPKGETDSEKSDFGILREDYSKKPVVELIKEHEFNPKKPVYTGELVVDEDAYTNNAIFFREMRREYVKLLNQGYYPKVKTPCTGTDSENSKNNLICQGNIKTDKSCELKCFKSEFEEVDLENGKIVVANTGEGTWKALNVKLVVGGKEFSLEEDVSWNEKAEFNVGDARGIAQLKINYRYFGEKIKV
ncbi:MAG: hypothetical protein AABX30_00725 [Nanoarchaeota archaeon]